MAKYVAQRIRFQNGERHSVLHLPNGLPVHEVTLYLGRYRMKGRAANTIHFACTSLALLYRELAVARINLIERFQEGRFLTGHELDRLAAAAQQRIDDMDDDASGWRCCPRKECALRFSADDGGVLAQQPPCVSRFRQVVCIRESRILAGGR